MRSTFTLDNDLYEQVQQLAQTENKPMSRVICEVLRKGMERYIYKLPDDDFPVIPVKPGGTLMTLETVNRLRDEQ